MLSCRQIDELLWKGHGPLKEDHLVIQPHYPFKDRDLGKAGVDIHLGCWFSVFREHSISSALSIDSNTPEQLIAKELYVPINGVLVLAPGQFVLGVTLEWFRFPFNLTAQVVGKSAWGRRGLIIATATGVHPSFVGCLTLEICNVGRVPVIVKPGLEIGQIMIDRVYDTSEKDIDLGSFSCQRKPIVGSPASDSYSHRRVPAPVFNEPS